MKHIKTRECDEWVCSCGLRWGLRDVDPHTKAFRREKNLKQLDELRVRHGLSKGNK